MDVNQGPANRSRVHFNAGSRDDEAEPTVNVASFDPDPGSEVGSDEARPSMQEEDDASKDITEVKSPRSFYFAESESEDDEQTPRTSNENAQQIPRILKFKSSSAPTSPQTSPDFSPSLFPQNRESDIPLVDLNAQHTTPDHHRANSAPSSGDTAVEREHRRKRGSVDTDTGKREAERLIRAHTKRNRSKDFFRRLSSGDILRSGQTTPDEEGHQHYHFNSGVLTNLLKLYSPQVGLTNGEVQRSTIVVGHNTAESVWSDDPEMV
jgi:hypothetical protein